MMTDDETNERPLVTFALFAYNQERYIREAIEGAFAQTYQPLEIILSDDCSSDGTFAIMQEMVASYAGPHAVRVTKTPANLGVVSHVLLRASEAKGDLIAVAAGDDISVPERSAELAGCFRDSSVMAASSFFELIDDRGLTIDSCATNPIADSQRKQQGLLKNVELPYHVIQGSTAAYRKALFDLPMPPPPLTFSEDNLFNFLIYSHGYRVELCRLPLVKYRTHPDALSNHGRKDLSLSDIEAAAENDACKEIAKMDAFEWMARTSSLENTVRMREIYLRRSRAQDIINWRGYNLTRRLLSVLRSFVERDLRFTKWKLLRLSGTSPRYQPKHFISILGGRL